MILKKDCFLVRAIEHLACLLSTLKMDNSIAKGSKVSLSRASVDEKHSRIDAIAPHHVSTSAEKEIENDVHDGRQAEKNAAIVDIEKGKLSPSSTQDDQETEPVEKPGKFKTFYRRHRIWFDIAGWMIITGWWAASLGLHHDDKNWWED